MEVEATLFNYIDYTVFGTWLSILRKWMGFMLRVIPYFLDHIRLILCLDPIGFIYSLDNIGSILRGCVALGLKFFLKKEQFFY